MIQNSTTTLYAAIGVAVFIVTGLIIYILSRVCCRISKKKTNHSYQSKDGEEVQVTVNAQGMLNLDSSIDTGRLDLHEL